MDSRSLRASTSRHRRARPRRVADSHRGLSVITIGAATYLGGTFGGSFTDAGHRVVSRRTAIGRRDLGEVRGIPAVAARRLSHRGAHAPAEPRRGRAGGRVARTGRYRTRAGTLWTPHAFRGGRARAPTGPCKSGRALAP